MFISLGCIGERAAALVFSGGGRRLIAAGSRFVWDRVRVC